MIMDTNTIALLLMLATTQTSELKTNVEHRSKPPEYVGWVAPIAEDWTYWDRVAPLEKWVTTTVWREDRLTFQWQGKNVSTSVSNHISATTERMFRVKQSPYSDWMPARNIMKPLFETNRYGQICVTVFDPVTNTSNGQTSGCGLTNIAPPAGWVATNVYGIEVWADTTMWPFWRNR